MSRDFFLLTIFFNKIIFLGESYEKNIFNDCSVWSFSIQASDLKYNIGYEDGDIDLGPASISLSNVILSVSYPIKYIEGLSVEAGISEPIGDDKLQRI